MAEKWEEYHTDLCERWRRLTANQPDAPCTCGLKAAVDDVRFKMPDGSRLVITDGPEARGWIEPSGEIIQEVRDSSKEPWRRA